MRTSISTRSARVTASASSAARPSSASPTTSMSGCASISMRKPARTSAWSSTRKTRALTPASTGVDLEAAAVARAGGERAVVHVDALAHPARPWPPAVAGARAPRPSSRTSSSTASSR